MKQTIVIGTRNSKLALWQTRRVASLLQAHHPELAIEIRHIITKGDKILDVPLAHIGDKGLFTKELEQEMLNHTIDIAVHSLKDMPTELPDDLCLAAISERQDAADALFLIHIRPWRICRRAPSSVRPVCAVRLSCCTSARTFR